VLIYFSDEFKRDVLSRMARSLNSPGYLFVGASESLINYTQDFEMLQHERALYYRVKAGGGS
jgi:chemotaxis protein methyltransferase CheR